jgi:hypothetical protein
MQASLAQGLWMSVAKFGQFVAYTSLVALSLGSLYVLGVFFSTATSLRINAFAKALTLIFLLTFLWFIVSLWFWSFKRPELAENVSFWRLSVMPRPSNLRERTAWWWGRSVLLSWVVGLTCVALLVILIMTGSIE